MKTILLSLFTFFGFETVQAGTGLDFSDVTSLEKAEALYAQGKLERVLLFPAEFGGKDIPQNVVFVPLGITEIKNQLNGTLTRFVGDGLINKLTIEPEYKGQSFIPAKIKMRAWHTDKKGEFNPSIDIW